MSRTRRLLAIGAILCISLSYPTNSFAEGAATRGTSVGIFINARGFLSLGISVTRSVDRYGAVRGSFEVPILLSAQKRNLYNHRFAVAAPFAPGIESRGGWDVRFVPEIFYVAQRNDLGQFRSVGVAGDIYLGFWTARDEDLHDGGGEGAVCTGGGVVLGAQWVPVTRVAPSDYLLERFEGIPGAESPSEGLRYSTRLGWHLGVFGETYTDERGGIAASMGFRGQPNRLDAFGKGFPYGELPSFLSIEGGLPPLPF